MKPRMDSFQNPCSESTLRPGSALYSRFLAPLRYLPLEENLWQIVLTVGVVPPGARNIPGIPTSCKRTQPCGRFYKKGISKRGISPSSKSPKNGGVGAGQRTARLSLFYYAAYVRDFLPINSRDGNILRDRVVAVLKPD